MPTMHLSLRQTFLFIVLAAAVFLTMPFVLFAQDVPTELEYLFDDVFALVEEGDFDAALELVNAAIADEKNAEFLPFLYNLRGIIYYYNGDLEAALDDFSEVLRLDPDYADAYFNRGSIYYSENNFDEAVDELLQVLQYDPVYWQPRIDILVRQANNTGDDLVVAENYTEALEQYDFASAMNSDPVYGYTILTNRAHVESMLTLYADSIRDYSRLIDLNPLDAWNFAYRGFAYYSSNQSTLALPDFYQHVRLAGENANETVLEIIARLDPMGSEADTNLNRQSDDLILYVSDRSGTSSLYTIRADGSDLQPVPLDGRSSYAFPHWSPDGTRILYTRMDSSLADSDIFVIDTDFLIIASESAPNFSERITTTQLTMSTSADIGLGWSPDSSQIVFISNRNSPDPQRADLFVMDADGSNIRQLTEAINVTTCVFWSDRGSQIAIEGTQPDGAGNSGERLGISVNHGKG
jgi:tetratricopeptide (TPR) repeat protein